MLYYITIIGLEIFIYQLMGVKGLLESPCPETLVTCTKNVGDVPRDIRDVPRDVRDVPRDVRDDVRDVPRAFTRPIKRAQ